MKREPPDLSCHLLVVGDLEPGSRPEPPATRITYTPCAQSALELVGRGLETDALVAEQAHARTLRPLARRWPRQPFLRVTETSVEVRVWVPATRGEREGGVPSAVRQRRWVEIGCRTDWKALAAGLARLAHAGSWPVRKGPKASPLEREDLAVAQRLRALYDLAPIGYASLDRRGHIAYLNENAADMLGHPGEALLGAPLVAFVPVEQADFLQAGLWGQLRGDRPRPVDLRLRNRAGDVRHVRLMGRRSFVNGRAELQLAMVDLTREVSMQENVDLMQSVLRSVLDSMQVAVVTTDSTGTVETANPACQTLFGHAPEDLVGTNLANFLSPLQELHSGNQVLWCRRSDGTAFLAGVKLSSLRSNARKLVLEVTDLTEARRSQQEIDDIRERERHRIGRDLHDDLGQTLTAMAFTVASLQSRLGDERTSPELRGMAERISHLCQLSIGKTRSLARDLYPASLERGGLEGALQELASDLHQIYRIVCEVRVGEVAVGRREALHLFRIAQEATHNAVKHASATCIWITIEVDGDMQCLTIRDNGVGLPVRVPSNQGLGMRSMRHHAGLLGGELLVDSVPSGGTRVSCQWPGSLHDA